MTAAAEPLKPAPGDQAVLAQLRARVNELNNQLAIEHKVNEVLRGQLADRTDERDQARRTVEQQQTEYAATRPWLVPLPHPRPAVRDVPTGGPPMTQLAAIAAALITAGALLIAAGRRLNKTTKEN